MRKRKNNFFKQPLAIAIVLVLTITMVGFSLNTYTGNIGWFNRFKTFSFPTKQMPQRSIKQSTFEEPISCGRNTEYFGEGPYLISRRDNPLTFFDGNRNINIRMVEIRRNGKVILNLNGVDYEFSEGESPMTLEGTEIFITHIIDEPLDMLDAIRFFISNSKKCIHIKNEVCSRARESSDETCGIDLQYFDIHGSWWAEGNIMNGWVGDRNAIILVGSIEDEVLIDVDGQSDTIGEFESKIINGVEFFVKDIDKEGAFPRALIYFRSFGECYDIRKNLCADAGLLR